MIKNAAPLLVGLGAVAGSGIAWLSGVLAPYGVSSPLIDPAAIADVAPEAARQELSVITKDAEKPAEPAVEPGPSAVPAFDIVRVQPDGSMVIAGRASAGAVLDILAGDRVIGTTTTDESGAFAFVLDVPLAPGDYEISLLAKSGDVATRSEETAVVQIPQQPDGDVLAIVTAPDQPAEVIAAGTSTATLAAPATQDEQAAVAATTVPAPVAAPEPATTQNAAVDVAPAANPAAPDVAPVAQAVAPRIGAVEIDGDQLIVSGTAAANATIRIYVGEDRVGDAIADAKGGFALLAQFPVAPGSHVVRADAIDPATGDVLARASVPFERVAGDAMAVAAAPVTEGQTGPSVLVPAADFGLGNKAPGFTAQTSVVIRKGDTLWQISRRVYGKGVRFSTIYNANAQVIGNPDRIWPGQVFVMPALTDDGAPADFEGIVDQKKVDVIVQ